MVASSSSRLTSEDALAVQYVSGDNHRVEVLREAGSAGRLQGLTRPAPLGEGKKIKGGLIQAHEWIFQTNNESCCLFTTWIHRLKQINHHQMLPGQLYTSTRLQQLVQILRNWNSRKETTGFIRFPLVRRSQFPQNQNQGRQRFQKATPFLQSAVLLKA